MRNVTRFVTFCDMPRVSVVIPTYNRKELLARALDSVFSQTCPADEVIVIDDGSTDGTRQYIAEEYPSVLIHFQEHSGVSSARNRGIRLSQFEWIAFLDSDDEWLPGKLESQLNFIRRNPFCKVCHTDEIWIRSGVRVNPKLKHEKSGGLIYEKCLQLCAMSPSSVIIHRDVFRSVGVFDEEFPVCEDYDLWLRITSRYPVDYLDEKLVLKYGGHEDQLSRTYSALDQYRIQALERMLNSQNLTVSEREQTLKVLLEKARIYLNGALKRQRHKEAARIQSVISRHEREFISVLNV